jgi:hypothetical protein
MYKEDYFSSKIRSTDTRSAASEPEEQRGRIGRSLHSEGLAWRVEGFELAAGPIWKIHPHDAALLAERAQPFNPRWYMGAAAGAKGELTAPRLPDRASAPGCLFSRERRISRHRGETISIYLRCCDETRSNGETFPS